MPSPQNSDSLTDDKKQESIEGYEKDYGRNDTANIVKGETKKDLRRIETKRQRATAAATMIMVVVNAAAFFVPEGVKKHIRLPRRIIIGIITAVLLLGTFLTLFWWYGGCDRYKILTHDTDGLDLDDCTIDPNSIFTTLRIDTNSKWEIESTFSQATAYWKVNFLGFGSKNSSNFQKSLTELRQQVNLFLENAVYLQTFELLQYFLHVRFLVRGDLGFAQLMPSFSLTSYTQNFELTNVKFFQANELQNCGKNGQQACDFSARVSDINNCASDVSGPFFSYNINRVGSSNGYYTIQRSGTQFLVRLNMKKQQTDENIVQLFDGDTCNENTLVSQPQNPITTREIPYFRECETCSLMDINFDIALITALDFCNKNIDICSSFYNFKAIPYSSSRVYTRIKQVVQSRFRTSRATFYDDNIGKFAYTKFELGNEYSIVPEIIPSCDACKVKTEAEDNCAKEFDIVFHYYFIRKLGDRGSAGSRRKTRKLLQSVNAEASSEASSTGGAPATATTAVSATTASPISQFQRLPNTSGNTWYTQLNGRTYIYTNLARNLAAAQSICIDYGGDMAYFLTQSEEDTITARLRNLDVSQPSNFVWTSLANPNATRETLCGGWNWVLSDRVLPLNYENWQGQCQRAGGHPRLLSLLYGGIKTPWKSRPEPSDAAPEWVTKSNSTQAAFLCTVSGIIASAPTAQPESAQKSATPQVPLSNEVLNNLGFIGTKSYYYSLQKLSWPAASQRCQSLGGNLLQLDSEATENTVNLLLNTNPLYQYTKNSSSAAYFWLGLQNVIKFDGSREQQWTTSLNSNYSNLDIDLQFYLPGTNQTSCVATFFQFDGQVPSSFWSSLSCERQNAFICEFTIDLKTQLGSLPKTPPVPSPPPPSPPQIQLQTVTPPPPPPPTQQILQQIVSSNEEVQQELQKIQEQEDPQDTVVTIDLQPEPQNQEIIEIDKSGYNFRTGQNIAYDQYGYQFSVLISLSSEEPQLAFNQFQTFMPSLQCNGSNIKFSSSNETTDVPFTLSSNIYECEIEQCRSTLEKLATSFANTELFYVLFALLMVLIVLACCLDRGALDEDSGTVVEHFYDIFAAMIDAVDP